jgi:hypothetical protein
VPEVVLTMSGVAVQWAEVATIDGFASRSRKIVPDRSGVLNGGTVVSDGPPATRKVAGVVACFDVPLMVKDVPVVPTVSDVPE